MKKILITGCSGYIGSHLCKLLENDYEIHGLDIKEPIVPINNQAAFNFKKRGVFISYVPGSHKVIHPRFNFSAGSSLATTVDKIKERGINFSPSIGIEANILSWLKVGAEGGYRIHSDFRTPALLQNSLSGSFFQIQVRYGASWNKFNNRNRWD